MRAGSLRLGLNIGYAGASPAHLLPLAERADDLGYHSVWAAEAYGSDAVSVLAFLAARTRTVLLGSAILQIPARTPANTAMTAMTLDHLSGGRLLLGLGVSGPQVVEGWHGVAYRRPLGRTREYVEIVRRAVAREEPLAFAGEHYRIPYDGPGATGLGTPLRSIQHPLRTRIPIYLAAMGPNNVALVAEIADGWLPMLYAPERHDAFREQLDVGFQRGGRAADDVTVCVPVPTAIGPDVRACRDTLRPLLALYIGGMGARRRNFYADLVTRYGFGGDAATIRDHFLAGRRGEAAAAVPDGLVDETCLVGPVERVRDRLAAWRESPADVVLLSTQDPGVLEALADLA